MPWGDVHRYLLADGGGCGVTTVPDLEKIFKHVEVRLALIQRPG